MSRFDRPPEIDYLAKDFASFRQLMLDQISLLVPDWQERHPADLGSALVDILAYAADYLSYNQDGIATEAYLGTARLRRSVRRHARLLDYILHNGCNARTWVHIALRGTGTYRLAKGTQLLAGADTHDQAWVASSEQAETLTRDGTVQVFTTMHDADLTASMPEVAFYVGGRASALLREGAVSALLADDWSAADPSRRALDDLKAGDVLIFEQRLDPDSGLTAGVDPSRRHAVRVTQVERTPLPRAAQRAEAGRSAASAPPPVSIEWDQSDALPFDLPVGSYRSANQGAAGRPISVALRNIVLVDHGAWMAPEPLPPVSSSQERYRPTLTYGNVTYATAYDHTEASNQPAGVTIAQRPAEAQAAVEVTEQHTLLLPGTGSHTPLLGKTQLSVAGARSAGAQFAGAQFASVHRWIQRPDLLSSDRSARTFVVESEDDGRAYLRFGFGGLGKGLSSQSVLFAAYRIGNGIRGNVGRHAIAHLVSDDVNLYDIVTQVRNPLPVTTGMDPEPIEATRLAAPYAFQAPLSCINPDDYAALALQLPGGEVRQTRARITRTGNWQTIFVYVQRRDDLPVDAGFQEQMLEWLRPAGMSGYEIAVRPPRAVGLELQLCVRVAPRRFRNTVRQSVLLALGSGLQDGGQPGFFHPDNFTFGQPVYASQVIRAAMAVDGVAQVEIARFGRLDDTRVLDPVPIGELEVARLYTDPDYPMLGTLRVDAEGGA